MDLPWRAARTSERLRFHASSERAVTETRIEMMIVVMAIATRSSMRVNPFAVFLERVFMGNGFRDQRRIARLRVKTGFLTVAKRDWKSVPERYENDLVGTPWNSAENAMTASA